VDQRFIDLLTDTLPLAPGRPITADDRLRDLGMDSMLAVELLVGIDERFAVTLSDDELNDTTFATAGSLWRTVRAALEKENIG
jgi:acyl carrier protein